MSVFLMSETAVETATQTATRVTSGGADTGGAILFTIVAIAILLAISAFFSGAETALTAASRGKLRARADKGDRGAETVLEVVEDREKLIGTILLGNNVVNILAASLASALFVQIFSSGAVALATLVMTALILIFSEVLPKTYALLAPEKLATRLAPPIRVAMRLLAPAVSLLRGIVRGLMALLGPRQEQSANLFTVQEEIAGALALGQSSGTVAKEDRDRLMGALDLGDRWVEEVMLHRSQIQMIDADKKPYQILQAVLDSPFTRLPVFQGERENVVGVIHAKDLLRAINQAVQTDGARALRSFDVLAIAMPPYFVPETTALDEQLREFLSRRAHFALVVDEYGSLRGLITLEDILEEIVGEIVDEHDRADQELRPNASGEYIVSGAMTIRDINRALDWSLPDDEANTIAGLVIHIARSIPQPGQIFSFGDLRFEVLSRRENRITRLRIRPATPLLPPPAAEDGDAEPQQDAPDDAPPASEGDSAPRRITPTATAPHIDRSS
ncbi:HlyC/CorC family transporter [uncultured Paracoccus sp.]|uniref:HlyC/CorC family transporter n=1 Tax=uncultured Paracoccus sp. TaxID=189685 RepID=UPI0025F538EB|nr:HlyC/CorC family transporter [uncultured Paracoccus sp.]